jgi:hypothetical protein
MKITTNGKIEGTRTEKVDFFINLFLWRYPIIIFLGEILILVGICIRLELTKFLIPFIPLLLFHWANSIFYYPYKPPIFYLIKEKLLLEGMVVRIETESVGYWHSYPKEYFEHGIIMCYDKARKSYKVKMLYKGELKEEVRYYGFQELNPDYHPGTYRHPQQDITSCSDRDTS